MTILKKPLFIVVAIMAVGAIFHAVENAAGHTGGWKTWIAEWETCAGPATNCAPPIG